MTIQPAKVDPIREKFFSPVESAEASSTILFGICIVLSLAAALLDDPAKKTLNSFVQWGQVVTVLALFALDLVIRLHWAPRAHDARAKDFLSKAFGAPLISQKTEGYFNHSENEPNRRLAAQLFENSLFTKEIIGKMLKQSSTITIIYIVLWVAAAANRDVSLSWIALFAQIIFGEQILARWIRMLWLWRRCEEVYSQMRQLYLSNPSPEKFALMALDGYTKYESSKAVASITLSTKIFEKLNPALSVEWDKHRSEFGI